MKKAIIILSAWTILVSSCADNSGSGKVTASTTSSGQSSDAVLNSELQKKVGSWVEKGVECYGIVIVNFNDGRTIGKPVKCKVVTIKPDKIRMKTVESVNLMESEGCNKLGLAYGDTWWEEEGDIFRTREEAEAYLVQKGWATN